MCCFQCSKQKNDRSSLRLIIITYRLNTSRSTTKRSVGVIVITVALRGSLVIKARSPKSKPATKKREEQYVHNLVSLLVQIFSNNQQIFKANHRHSYVLYMQDHCLLNEE